MFESGKNYVGKGGFKRAIKSATDHIKIGDAIDDVVSIAWAPAKNAKQAFVLEFFLQVERHVNNASTYNKIWSPGKHIFWSGLNEYIFIGSRLNEGSNS